MSAIATMPTQTAASRRALLSRLLDARNGRAFPLSLAQQRLWFLEELNPNRALYNMPEVWRVSGPLDVMALQTAINGVVERHDSLRTTFQSADGAAIQIVSPKAAVKIAFCDLREFSNPETLAWARVGEAASRPFDLRRGPLLRVEVFQLADEAHLVFLNMHHIISDGWSFHVFRREVQARYEAAVSHQSIGPSALPIQYADFAKWQREQQGEAAFGQQLHYWRERLKGFTSLPLPTRGLSSSQRTYFGALEPFTISSSLHQQLDKLARANGATLFMTLLAAFKVLLHRYTQQGDILIGTPVSGRSSSETEDLIGLFANTLPLRTTVNSEDTFLDVLGRVRETTLGAFAHQDVPFDSLVRELHPGRNANQNPFFEVVFGFQGAAMNEWSLPGTKMQLLQTDTGTAKFAWTLLLFETRDGIQGRFEYSTEMFDAAFITRAIGHFLTLLKEICSKPGEQISKLRLLTDTDERQLLVEFNQTRVAYEREACVQELFETQAAARPDAVALVCGERRVSYRELNNRANELAQRLIALGVGPDVAVAVCIERSVELIVSLLAILKAGGAYVPLDTHYPHERLIRMIEDCGASVILAGSETHLNLCEGRELITLCVDAARNNLKAEKNPGRRATATNLAYILYTSGSTGQPKGVCVPHRAVARLVRGANYAEFSANDVLLLASSISFDASTLEIWGSLLNGARLVIPPPGLLSLEQLGELISKQGVTTLWLTAGLFHQMVDFQCDALRGVRQLLAGGDVLSPSHVAKARKQLPLCKIINGYGPTENTTFTCCFSVPERWNEDAVVPIGKPLSNTQVVILDSRGELVPVGIPGELHAGGDGLARGYLNDAKLTAEKFIPNPFPEIASERLYRTGDFARWLPDGNVEFIGRNDLQVKIRGFRIELGEIESVLNKCPGVAESVVIARETASSGDRQLVAYLVSKNGDAPKISDVRQNLERRIPPHMMPHHIVLLSRLPLTANGKVNRAALPEPEWHGSTNEFTPPQTETQRALAGVWSEVLGLKRVSIHDNFFELGGHSLLMTQIISRLNRGLRIELPIRSFFDRPTIAGLAAEVEERLLADIHASESGNERTPDMP